MCGAWASGVLVADVLLQLFKPLAVDMVLQSYLIRFRLVLILVGSVIRLRPLWVRQCRLTFTLLGIRTGCNEGFRRGVDLVADWLHWFRQVELKISRWFICNFGTPSCGYIDLQF